MWIRVDMRRKQYFVSVSQSVSRVIFSKHVPGSFSQNRTQLSTVFHKISFSRIVPLSAFFFKFHTSPTTRKLLVRLRLFSADGTNLSARGPGYRASPNLTACLQSPFTVCCARLAQTS